MSESRNQNIDGQMPRQNDALTGTDCKKQPNRGGVLPVCPTSNQNVYRQTDTPNGTNIESNKAHVVSNHPVKFLTEQ